MGFKFLNKEQVPDQPEHIIQDRFNELVGVQNHINMVSIPTVFDRPSVYININRNRNDISEEEMTHILRQQRRMLIERMWEQRMVTSEIVSLDENGFSIRTELVF